MSRLIVIIFFVCTTAVLGVKFPEQSPLTSAEHQSLHGEHVADYDHEAFLGYDEAHRFDSLSEQEAKSALGKLFDRVDENSDGRISGSEMLSWIEYIQKKKHLSQADGIWKQRNLNLNASMNLDTYDSRITSTPSGIDERSLAELEKHRTSIKRRWKAADVNNDNKLSREEYVAFHSPSDYSQMHQIVVQEILEDMDEDGDGVISEEEYLASAMGEDAELGAERSGKVNFESMDTNGNGKLDLNEAIKWLSSSQFSTEQEAQHLISEADDDHDKTLSKAEVMNHWQLFVGSRATSHGDLHIKQEL